MFRSKPRSLTAAAALMLVTALFATAALAARPASRRKADPLCTIDPSPAGVGQTYIVSASGLPTSTAINLWVTDPSANSSGRPLGSTPDGTFNLNESSSSAGTWTYTFSGPTKNNNTQVYSTCSVVAS